MKKTRGSYYCRYFNMPYLHRDDVEKIEAIIREKLKPSAYHIAYDGFEYDAVSDMAETGSPIYVMVFYTHAPSIRLKFARSWAELYAGDLGAETEEAVRAIADVVAGSERKWLWNMTKYSSWLAPILGFGTVAVTTNLMIMHLLPISFEYVNLMFLCGTAIWWAVGYRYRLFRFSRVDLSRRR
ncbi:MAG TPA: hypothetical protein VMU17_00745 [Elusimicrobiota bacterium]|nr:hypothetical protein [Elusimicrobiota bacterium]